METKQEMLAFLEEAKAKKAELESLEKETDAKEIEYKKAAKSFKNETKAVEDSIALTIKKRKAELTKSYDEELDRIESLIKDEKEARAKAKEKGQNARFDSESYDVREEIRQQKIEINALFKKNDVPSICDTKFFYALTSPKGMTEILILIATILVCFVAIPLITYAIIGSGALSLVLIYLVCIVIFVGIYVLFFMKQKEKNGDVLAEGRQIRNRIEANEKEVSAIRKSIKDDKNEEMYNLGEFDEKLKDLNAEKAEAIDKKNAAIEEFDSKTSKQIEQELMANSKERLALLEETAGKAKIEYEGMQDTLQGLNLDMASKYETVLGKDYKVEELKRYAEYIEHDTAANITEAQELYKLNAPVKMEAEIDEEDYDAPESAPTEVLDGDAPTEVLTEGATPSTETNPNMEIIQDEVYGAAAVKQNDEIGE